MTLQITGASKSYGSFRVLHDIDFQVAPGEVHALLGPNGAGKSTLIKCIGGVQSFDDGTVTLDSEPLTAATPSAAFDLGIATIHQHLSLIDSLSVTDNIFLGRERTRGSLIRKRAQTAQTRELLDRFAIPVHPSTIVGTLPIGMKQLIEVAKAWHRTDVRVLILDEPTSALAEEETLNLFDQVERLKAAGARIIYTTHRLGEIYRIADRVTVIRDGGVALTGRTEEIEPSQIVSAISGRAAENDVIGTPAAQRVRSEAALTAERLAGPRFGPIDISVRAGEIVGLYGVLGSGRTSLLETITGAFRADAGAVAVDGISIGTGDPARAIAAGIAFVPSDRKRQALWGSLSAGENLLMARYGATSFASLRSGQRERSAFNDIASRLELQPPDMGRNGGDFSGGNQQKLVLGRWLLSDELRVLVLDEPTQGVDVGARRKIYETCAELAARGVAIIFSSSDADEIVRLADRVIVMDGGTEIAQYSGAAITEEQLLSSAHELV